MGSRRALEAHNEIRNQYWSALPIAAIVRCLAFLVSELLSVLIIAGSPARNSRSSALLDHLSVLLRERGIETRVVTLRDIPAEDLIDARFQSPAARIVRAKVDIAKVIIVATPVYNSSLSGGLKALLDLLPRSAGQRARSGTSRGRS